MTPAERLIVTAARASAKAAALWDLANGLEPRWRGKDDFAVTVVLEQLDYYVESLDQDWVRDWARTAGRGAAQEMTESLAAAERELEMAGAVAYARPLLQRLAHLAEELRSRAEEEGHSGV
jgi:hypothetical protein